jgi:hypothetical protein
MKSYNNYQFDLDNKDFLMVTDHDHTKQVTLHARQYDAVGGFGVTLTPHQMPSLLKAISVLLQYADEHQTEDTLTEMDSLLLKYRPIPEEVQAEKQNISTEEFLARR